jgi:hypothetical protein
VLLQKVRQRKYRDIADKLISVGLTLIPTRLRAGRLSRSLASPEHRLKALGATLARVPFDSERHNDFADALVEVRAFGAARMHYEQALALKPGDERASSGISLIDGPRISDRQRATYFVSWSDDRRPLESADEQIEVAAGKLGAPLSRMNRFDRLVQPYSYLSRRLSSLY